jgi:hypothetical protein
MRVIQPGEEKTSQDSENEHRLRKQLASQQDRTVPRKPSRGNLKVAAKGSVEKARLHILEPVRPKQSVKQIGILASRLSKAESNKRWNTVIELGERILESDSNHGEAKSKTEKPVFAKLSPNTEKLVEVAQAVEDPTAALKALGDPARSQIQTLHRSPV